MSTPSTDMHTLPPFDATALLAAARTQTGLNDFGLPPVEEPLHQLIDSFLHEAHLTPVGEAGQRMNLLRLLGNRLRLQKELIDHPEIRAQVIRGPIVVIGLPRSGTTKLQRMIAADPRLQHIPFWRMLHPVPIDPPGQSDSRVAIAEAVTAYTKENFPAFYAAHSMGATEPEEEDFLMEHSLATSATFSSHRVPSFQAWVQNSDPAPFYDLLHSFLQYFQWQDDGAGRMWVIKATCHLHRLRWLFRVFPEATVVHCHRDPVTSLTSLADMFYEVRKMGSDYDNPLEVGEFTLKYSLMQMEQYFAQRPLLEQRHRIVDVAFNDIVARPLNVIQRVYTTAGIEFTDAARTAMRQWEQENPQHKHGKRDYRPEKFGYTEVQLRTDFAQYLERFVLYL